MEVLASPKAGKTVPTVTLARGGSVGARVEREEDAYGGGEREEDAYFSGEREEDTYGGGDDEEAMRGRRRTVGRAGAAGVGNERGVEKKAMREEEDEEGEDYYGREEEEGGVLEEWERSTEREGEDGGTWRVRNGRIENASDKSLHALDRLCVCLSLSLSVCVCARER